MGSEKSKRVAEHSKQVDMTGKSKAPKIKIIPLKKEGEKEKKEPYERRDSGISQSSYPGSLYRGRYSTATYGVSQYGTQTIEMREFGIQTERTRQVGIDKLIPMCDYRENEAQTLCHMEMQTVPEKEIHPEKSVAIQTLPYDEGGLKVEEVATQTVYEDLMEEKIRAEADNQDPFAYDDIRFLVSAAGRFRDQQAKLKVKIIRPRKKGEREELSKEDEKSDKKKKSKKGEEKKRKKEKKSEKGEGTEKKKKRERGKGREKKKKSEKGEETEKKKNEKDEGTEKKKSEKSEGIRKKKRMGFLNFLSK